MRDEQGLGGRTAFVTGGASGLGRATALALAAAGARVIVADIDPASAARTVEEIATKGGRADAVAMDVTDDEARRRAIGGAFAEHGDSFDILVNVAGIDHPGYANDIGLADFERVMAVNCTGPGAGAVSSR